MRSDNTVNAAIQGKAKLDAAFRQHMANKFPFATPPAGLHTIRTHADLTVRSDDLLARLARLEQVLAQQK